MTDRPGSVPNRRRGGYATGRALDRTSRPRMEKRHVYVMTGSRLGRGQVVQLRFRTAARGMAGHVQNP